MIIFKLSLILEVVTSYDNFLGGYLELINYNFNLK